MAHLANKSASFWGLYPCLDPCLQGISKIFSSLLVHLRPSTDLEFNRFSSQGLILCLSMGLTGLMLTVPPHMCTTLQQYVTMISGIRRTILYAGRIFNQQAVCMDDHFMKISRTFSKQKLTSIERVVISCNWCTIFWKLCGLHNNRYICYAYHRQTFYSFLLYVVLYTL